MIRGDESGPTGITEGTPVNYTAAVTGTLTSDGSTPVVFPSMLYVGQGIVGLAHFTDTGSYSTLTPWTGYRIYPGTGSPKWQLAKIDASVVTAAWLSDDDVVTPDLVTTWTPQGSATGTPVVTLTEATAGYVGSQYVDDTNLYVVAFVTGGIPHWRKIAHSAL